MPDKVPRLNIYMRRHSLYAVTAWRHNVLGYLGTGDPQRSGLCLRQLQVGPVEASGEWAGPRPRFEWDPKQPPPPVTPAVCALYTSKPYRNPQEIRPLQASQKYGTENCGTTRRLQFSFGVSMQQVEERVLFNPLSYFHGCSWVSSIFRCRRAI